MAVGTLEMLDTAVWAHSCVVSSCLSLLEIVFLPAGRLRGDLVQVPRMSALSWVGTVV